MNGKTVIHSASAASARAALTRRRRKGTLIHSPAII